MATKKLSVTIPIQPLRPPEKLLELCKGLGFQFDSETCPIRFKRPFEQTINEAEGTITLTQEITTDD
jgi:hypothetical protein